MNKLYLVISFLLLFTFPALSKQDLKITWALSDSPPTYISNHSNMSNRGTCDALMNHLIDAMPDVRHEVTILPQSRIGKMMDEGNKICYPCMIHRIQNTSRATYSLPAYLYPAISVITSKKLAPHLTKLYGNPIDIEKLMSNKKIQYGRQNARKYTKELQPIVENSLAYKRSIVNFNFKDSATVLFDLLKLKRIDYFTDYPVTATYHKKIGYKNIEVIPIKQLESAFTLGAVGCATSAADSFAINAISKIDKALQKTVLKAPNYTTTLNYWLSESMPNYLDQYNQNILKSASYSN
ncbi:MULTISPECIES: hypothetical protein [unclassified Pseudoalteromonas]|uniref:hypothetical protein n=1 Tax=unclassified Pseudoalteromonas TaxID=194690 RepID=UPI0005AAF748|nr:MULTISPECIES: hypothetical protein [unclassified Pseudoalteromonas]